MENNANILDVPHRPQTRITRNDVSIALTRASKVKHLRFLLVTVPFMSFGIPNTGYFAVLPDYISVCLAQPSPETPTVCSCPPPQLPGCDQDVSQWDSSEADDLDENQAGIPMLSNALTTAQSTTVGQAGVKQYGQFQNEPLWSYDKVRP